ncbi:MAG: hypothetical protein P4L96_12375 [Rhodoferax sp.]|nr:hypothetical protein [Rhodoferax sp.]
MKTPTPAEINKTSREFWAKRNTTIDEHLARLSSALAAAATEIDALVADDAFHADKGPLAHVRRMLEQPHAALKQALSDRQRAIAKKPRPKAVPTARSETIAAMRQWRPDGRTLQDFLDAAGAGSIEGASIKPANLRGVDKFSVECDAVTDAFPPVSRSTLEEWWRAAKK